MNGITPVENRVYYAYSTEEAMAPPDRNETQEIREVPSNKYARQEGELVNILQAGESVGLGNIKFKPIDGLSAFQQYSPMERMEFFGHWNTVKNVNTYFRNSMYKGIGSFVDIKI